MKVTSLLIAILALSSCVAKPWFVGSVNDHYTYATTDTFDLLDITPPGDLDNSLDIGGSYDNGQVGRLRRRSVKGHPAKVTPLGETYAAHPDTRPPGSSGHKSLGSALKSFGSSLKSIGSAKPKPTTKVTNP